MADLATVLNGLAGQGASLVKGTIDSVQVGTLTVQINGGTFTRVPYLRGGWVPAPGQQVYLLAQKGWGMFAVGSPADAPAPADLPAQAVATIEPMTMSNWQVSAVWPQGHWVDLTGDLVQTSKYVSAGVWFYEGADLAASPVGGLSRLEMQIQAEEGEFVELALHSSPAPAAGTVLQLLDEPSRTYRLTPGEITRIGLPLHWGGLLNSNDALGIVARSDTYDARLFGYGELYFTGV